MAESSIDSFVYVIWAFTILCTVVITLRSAGRPRRHNFRILNSNPVISQRTLLQINATVIAGLFVFLTIQGNTVANLPALIDTNVTMTKIEKFDEIRHDEKRDDPVRKEAEKRYAEATLDLEEKFIRLKSAYDFQKIQYFTNPIVIFSASLLPFSLSCLFAIGSRNEQALALKISKLLTGFGFFLMFAGALFFVGFPIVPS